MLLREIKIEKQTLLVEELADSFQIMLIEEDGERKFLHIYDRYEPVKATLDEIMGILDQGRGTSETIMELLTKSKDI